MGNTTPPSVIPQSLHPGDTIAIISPSARYNELFEARLTRALTFLSAPLLSFNIRTIFTPLPPNASFLDQIHHRCSEVHTAFADPDIKGIICTIGGSHANELVRYLDYQLIGRNPKVFVGYSDITVLHYAISSQTGLRTIYGPAAISEFGEYPEPLPLTADHFSHILINNLTKPDPGPLPRSEQFTTEWTHWSDPSIDTARPRILHPSPAWKWYGPQRSARGPLEGGCLSPLSHLTGTRYFPSSLLPSSTTTNRPILFLETPVGDDLIQPYSLSRVRQQLVNLANIGVFSRIAGLIFGRPSGITDEKGFEEFEKAVMDILESEWNGEQGEGKRFPVVFHLDIGHTDPNLTLPLGADVEMDPQHNEVRLLGQAVS